MKLLRDSWRAWLLAACVFGGPTWALGAGGIVDQTAALRLGLRRAWFSQAGGAQPRDRLTFVTLDDGALIAQTSASTLTSMDAETGGILWERQVGRPGLLTTAPGIGPKFVASVTGSTLHVLDRATGRIMWERDLKHSPGAGPAVTDAWVWVPMLGGMINAFRLERPESIPWTFASSGRVLTQPVATLRSVCWTTERGHMYVANADVPSIRFRLEAKRPIDTSPAYWTPYLFAASLDGYVMAVDDVSAAKNLLAWKFPTGEAIRVAPAAVAGRVFVAPERAGLYCLDAKSGDQIWYTPGIRHFLALSATRVYAIDELHRLVALDANTGNRQGTLSLDPQVIRISNTQSDRIYLATRDGMIQCLHEIAQPRPLRHEMPPLPKFDDKSGHKPKAPAETAPPKADVPAKPHEPDAEEPPEEEPPAEEPETPTPKVIEGEDLFG